MNKHTLQIRNLCREDIVAVLPIHKEAFKGTLGVALGHHYLNVFLRWFIDNPENVCLVCTLNENIAGYVFGAPVGYGTALNRDLLTEITRAIVTHPWVLLHPTFLSKIRPRMLSLLGLSPATLTKGSDQSEAEVKAISLVAIGVEVNSRRNGVASALINTFEEVAAKRGFEQLRLTVYRTNEGACRFYEVAGWTVWKDDGAVLTYVRRSQAITG